MGLPETEQLHMLFQSILALKNEDECRRYFEDLCTIKEAQDLAQRLDIARRLARGDPIMRPRSRPVPALLPSAA